jgi:ferredoxin
MAYIVTSNCQDCAFTDCVEVCPVQCFYDGREIDRMLFIHPDECIDCSACVPECPVEAIFAEEDTPESEQAWIQINADKTLGGELPVIAEKTDPLPTAAAKKEKLGL